MYVYKSLNITYLVHIMLLVCMFLALDSLLACSSLGKITTSASSFLQLPICRVEAS